MRMLQVPERLPLQAAIQRVAIEESGPKDFDADTVVGFDAPAGTSSEVVSHLIREIDR